MCNNNCVFMWQSMYAFVIGQSDWPAFGVIIIIMFSCISFLFTFVFGHMPESLSHSMGYGYNGFHSRVAKSCCVSDFKYLFSI